MGPTSGPYIYTPIGSRQSSTQLGIVPSYGDVRGNLCSYGMVVLKGMFMSGGWGGGGGG